MADINPPASRRKVKGTGSRKKRQVRKARRDSTAPRTDQRVAGGRPNGQDAPASRGGRSGQSGGATRSGDATRTGRATPPVDSSRPTKGAARRPVRDAAAAVAHNAPASASDPVADAARPGAGFRNRQSYAAIDLGTNNCRLLIARPSGDHFVVVDAFSRVVRLGEGLAQTGRLSEAAMDRAVAALRVCAEKLKRRNVHLARSVATEACRRAANGNEFIERVRRETGICLDIISAREEARLAVLGCHILLEPGPGPALVFDIGGGSTELVLVDNTAAAPRILDWVSVPWGVVSLHETCGGEEEHPDDRLIRYTGMRQRVANSFAEFSARIAPLRETRGDALAPLRLLGTSGTVTTLASLHLDLPQYDRRAVDGLIMPTESMRRISTRLSGMSLDERREVPCIGRERADLVVAGCAILETILDLWPAERLGIADRGIREGILRSLIGNGPSGDTDEHILRGPILHRTGR